MKPIARAITSLPHFQCGNAFIMVSHKLHSDETNSLCSSGLGAQGGGTDTPPFHSPLGYYHSLALWVLCQTNSVYVMD